MNKKWLFSEFNLLFWILIIMSFLGDLLEVAFVYLNSGKLMSRSSLLYGPFSLTWGGGAALLSLFYVFLESKSITFLFLFGTLAGGIFEYLCSFFSEKNYGFVFWEYSNLKFHLNGRINLLLSLGFGLFTVIWIKMLYPFIRILISPITKEMSPVITVLAIILFLINVFLTRVALNRYAKRAQAVPAKNLFQNWIDETYHDEFIEYRYQNIDFKGNRAISNNMIEGK